MIRSRSVSSMGGNSSTMTGESLQMALEGQWDETISIQEIHEGIVSYLTEKLESLKNKYLRLKGVEHRKQEKIMKRVVAARIKYQRYMNVTKDVLQNCSNFMKVRRDTPNSRIAFIRNVQTYIAQAKEFIKMDITLKKISPTLLNYIQPNPSDSAENYARKREMRRAMSLVLQHDKGCLTTNGAGKLFRSRYAQQNRFIHHGFPDVWIQYFPVVLRNSLKEVNSPDKRWLITIMYIFSKHCSVNYIQQGYCSSCLFPIIHQRSEGVVGGKLYCLSCKKEIDWTYYMNPRTICLILSGFHLSEIDECKETIVHNICQDPVMFDAEDAVRFFEDSLDEYVANRMNIDDVFSKPSSSHSSSSVDVSSLNSGESRTQETVDDGVPSEETHVETARSDEALVDEKNFPSFGAVLHHVAETLRKIYGDDVTIDFKSAKESYALYRSEIISFEGNHDDPIPRGVIPKVERYVCHYYKLPSKEEVRKLPLTDKGDRAGTSKKMIHDALVELSLGKYCHLVSKIAQKLWGSQLPSMKEHYLEILHECVLQKEVFNRLSVMYGRKSNINQRVILMFICQRYKYKWTEDDFRVGFSSTTLSKQLEILREIFTIIDGSQEV